MDEREPDGVASRSIPALGAVRGVAVFLVVVHHAASLAGPGRSGVLETPAAVSDVGVALFFVLSGFLIYRPFAAAHATGRPGPPTRSFYWRRALRVLPAYWAALAVFISVGVIEPRGFTDLASHVFLVNVFRPASLFNGISQGWSLTAELCFYLLVPAWSFALRRRRRGLRGTRDGGPITARTELLGIATIVAFAHLFRAMAYSVDWHVGAATLRGISYLWLPTHLDTIAAGMALAVFAVHRRALQPRTHRLLRPAVSWVGATIVLGVYAITFGGPSISAGYTLAHLEVRQIVYTFVGVAVVAPLVLRTPTEPSAMTSAVLTWTAALSYGVYLFHNDWMEWLTRRAGSGRTPGWLGTGLNDMSMPGLLSFGVLAGVASALVTGVLIETPSRRLRHLFDGDNTSVSVVAKLSERTRTRICLAVVGIALLAPVPGLMAYQGPPMEEGFMLAFPEQLLAGRLPHRDFLHLYGPASLWVLAALYRLFGTSLALERMVGLAQHAAVAFSMFALLAPWGRRVATSAALISTVVLISPLGLSAMAWNGALAAALGGLAIGTAAARRPDDPRSRQMLVVSGALGGVALLYRPDLVVAVAVGFGAIVLGLERHRRRYPIVGAIATSMLYVPHVLMSGIEASFRGMFVEPVFELRGGRSLPVPPSLGEVDGFLQRAGAIRVVGWPFPMPATSVQISLWFWLVPISALGVVAVAWTMRRRSDPRSATLWPASLFGAALMTQAVQRPDTAHLSWVTGVTFALAVPAAAVILGRLKPQGRASRRAFIAAAPIAVVLVGIIPFYPMRTYADLVTQTLGYNRFGYPIRRADRVFYYGSEGAADDAQRVVERLGSISRPGQHLIVGTIDLSKTPYSDAFFYFLFPDLPPGTRYIEMDPGLADAADSGLAGELRRSDWLIRSGAWAGWDEPNDSRIAGSPEPNRVVDELYCMELDAGTFQLLRRCRSESGT